MTPWGDKLPISVLVAYYATVAAFFVASFYPEYRVWGISWWAYFPLWVKLVLLSISLAAPTVIDRVIDRTLKDRDDVAPTTYRWLVGGFVVVMLALFYFLRARTHFLGDGYALLGQLASGGLIVKPHEFAATKSQQLIYTLLGQPGESSALIAYQIVSIVCGIIFLALCYWLTSIITHRCVVRVFALMTLGTTGSTLLFFGYVENYALFAVAVMLTVTWSVYILKNDNSALPIVFAVAFAFLCHILAVALIPAVAFLVMRNTRAMNWLVRQSGKTKASIAAGIILIFALVFAFTYSTWVFFRLAFLPLLRNQFTVDGYTLLSASHLLDFINLLLILCPALALLIISRVALRSVTSPDDRPIWLALVLFLLPSLLLVFLLDPKLGMPRDWDLLSFAGIPLAIIIVAVICSYKYSRLIPKILGIVVVLNILALFPRAVAVSNFSVSSAHAEQFAAFDPNRSGPLRFVLTDTFGNRGDTATVSRLKRQWQPDLRADELEVQAAQLMNADRREEALPLLRQLLELRPNTYGAWQHLGEYFFFANQYDSSLYYMKVAEGVNPYNRDILCNTGVLLFFMRRLDEAKDYFERATEIDSLYDKPLVGLASIYAETGQSAKYEQFLLKITAREVAPPEIWSQLVGHYIRTGKIADAQRALDQARRRRVDAGLVQQWLGQSPALK